MLNASFTTLSQCYLAYMTWLANSSESKDENDAMAKNGLLYYEWNFVQDSIYSFDSLEPLF